MHRCFYCKFETSSRRKLGEHRLKHRHNLSHNNQKGMGDISKKILGPFTEISAFRGYAKTFRHRISPLKDMPTLNNYNHSYEKNINEIVKHYLDSRKSIKIQVSVLCNFERENQFFDKIEIEECQHYMNSNMKIILNVLYVKKVMKQIIIQLSEAIDIFEKNGSGWKLSKVLGCDIRMAEFKLFKGGCFVPVPTQFKLKRAIISPQNPDMECFIWAFLIIMHYDDTPPTNKSRIKQYERFKDLYDFSDLSFPTQLSEVKKFEKTNRAKNFSLNVFGLDDRNELNIKHKSVFFHDKTRKKVNLLYVQEHHNGPGHWMAITAITRLLGNHNCHKRELCYNCFNTFDEKMLQEHETLCFQFKTQKVVMPEVMPNGKPVCVFKNYSHKLKTRFVIYADFEALCVDPGDQANDSNSTILSNHEPSGFGIVVIDSSKPGKNKVILKNVYRGKDCMDSFVQELDIVAANLIDMNDDKKTMRPLTKRQLERHKATNICHICEKIITPEQTKVMDHNHYSSTGQGRYRGPAHLQCNAEYVQFSKIPVVMHNFKNYDSNLLLSSIKKFSQDYVNVIPQTSEKFLSIITQKFYFVDSFMHLTSSLDQLTKDLLEKDLSTRVFNKRFQYLVQVFGKKVAKRLSRKGVFPYEFMDSWDKFNETKFPTRKKFYSTLTSSTVSKDDWSYGKQIFKDYCNNLGEYHDLYLLTDTLLLACVFENFRSTCMKHYKLDPVRYFSLAGYAWDSALYASKQELELLVDQTMYNMFEVGIRGGVSIIAKRYAKANNRYMASYKPSKPSKYILFIDKNNLYGEALTQHLPVSEFQWESSSFVENLTKQEIMDWKDDSDVGRILSVDLEYPLELHSEHNQYCLAPEKIPVPKAKLSPYQQDLIKQYGIKYSDKTNKLIPHLGPRKDYVIHYRQLKYCLAKGMVLTKVNSCIRFVQRPWLKDFVHFNAKLRRDAKNEFEKNLFKTVVNSIFGKSAQQVRNKEDVKIVSKLEKFQWMTKHSNFKRFQILNPELIIVVRSKNSVVLDKPIYTAFTVLELSKLFMAEWHFDKIRAWYGDRATFLVTDTDSLGYCIETEDLYKDLQNHADEFDFSDYDPKHFLHSNKNKKTIGKMKDEAKGQIIFSFVGLGPKMYSMEGALLRKVAAKGVKKAIVKRFLDHRKFKEVLLKEKKFISRFNQIRSKNHKLFTGNFTKVALHCFDSKRFILEDGISSLAHNHYQAC